MSISIVMPVGPKPAHKQWIGEAMASVRAQTIAPSELFVVDDMADVYEDEEFTQWAAALEQRGIGVPVYRAPWRLGVASAMNFGVALAKSEFVFMMSADDTLEPELIARLQNALDHMDAETASRALFFVGVKYLDGREEDEQFIACGAAMVSKSLWAHCGGFPPETASGAPDAALISIMIGNPSAGQTIGVGQGHTLYNVRSHPDQDTAGRSAWQRVILESRDLLTGEWKPIEWCRSID